MSTSKSMFINALREIASKEFRNIPYENEINIYESEKFNVISAFWIEDGYVFELDYCGGDLETLKQIVLSIK